MATDPLLVRTTRATAPPASAADASIAKGSCHGKASPPTIARTAVTLLISYGLVSAALIGVGLVLTHLLGPVVRWDDHVNSWLAARRTSGWNAVSKDGTFIANTLGIVAVGAIVTVVALLTRCGRMAVLVVCALAVEIAAFVTVNFAVARPRPAAPHLGATPSTYSFPSGHVAATFVIYGGIAVIVASRTRISWARVCAWVVAVGTTTWVALSRVYEAEHHPTDVLAGLLLGVGALCAAVVAIRPAWPTGAARPTSDDTDRLAGTAAGRSLDTVIPDGRRTARPEMAR